MIEPTREDNPITQSIAAVPLKIRVDGWIFQFVSFFNQARAIQIGLVVILVVAGILRINGLDWDSGRHLHPDERFLTTVTNDLELPKTLEHYFNSSKSTLSPYSLEKIGMFVYGTLPIYIVKAASALLNNDTYDKIPYVGRVISTIFDLGAILVLYFIGQRLYGKKVGLLAAAFGALSVLNIQLSHFYAVDTFANLFILTTIYLLLRASSSGRWLTYLLVGLMFGMGLASKLSVVTLLVPILAAIGLDFYRRSQTRPWWIAFEQSLVRLLTVFILAALAFRVLQPVAFTGPTFMNWELNPAWLEDVLQQQKILTGTSSEPWVQQWTGRSFLFPFYNLVVWGLGIPLGLAGFAGFGLAAYELIKKSKIQHLLPLVFVTMTIGYHAITFIRFMRYFLPVYPFLGLFAAYGIAWLWRRAHPASASEAAPTRPISRLGWIKGWLKGLRLNPRLVFLLAGLVLGGTLLYALAFSAIYSVPHTRVSASRWIYENVPTGSTLASEHWDDVLPIGGLDGKTAYGATGPYKQVQMTNYEDDTPDKLEQMVQNLSKVDYVVLSSNRLYDSIPRLPLRYPMTIRYYELLFKGELGFEQVAEFTSYPRLLGIQLPDQVAEEAFSVYDHPRVLIFQKTATFDPEVVKQKLGGGINWSAVMRLTPKQGTDAPNGLQLSLEDQALYEQAAVKSSAGVSDQSWGNRHPLLAWFLVLQLIALLALPLTFSLFRNLADRGYLFSKALGVLIVGWGAWMIASLRLAPFTGWVLAFVLGLLALSSGWIAWKRRWELWKFLQKHWRLVLLEEFLFWVFFGLSLFLRWSNPDLWHPWMGGEKPMDLAYLTAIVQTPYFPSYDPWFSGGYINYYYFGFVLVASLIHLTGILPTTAYNLAVPTFFAMTALGSFSVALNLVAGFHKPDHDGQPRRQIGKLAVLAGVCGALFVAVLGNLGQLKLLWDAIRELSSLKETSNINFLAALAQFVDGLNQWIGGKSLGIRNEWWYWNATRLIPAAKGESGPINELPFFTFLFADLHAHMMALPYTLLALGMAVNVVRDGIRKGLQAGNDWLTLGGLALVIGALWPLNTWDYPTYFALAAAALAIREFSRRRRVDWPGVWAVAWRAVLVIIGGYLLFLPFHQNYAGANFGAEIWNGSRTPLKSYLLIHGFFLFIILSYLLVELFSGRGHNALVRTVQHTWRYLKLNRPIKPLLARLMRTSPGYRAAVRLSKWLALLTLVVLIINPVIGLALALCLLTALLLFSKEPDGLRQFGLCLIGLGLLLTGVVEVVVLKGDIGRMNTVFKFYLQVWVMFGTASAAALVQLMPRFIQPSQAVHPVVPRLEVPEGSAWTPEVAALATRQPRSPGRLRETWWWWIFGILLAGCLLYPVTAVPARLKDRFTNSTAKTLDGTTYMQTAVYSDEDRPVTLEWDLQAIEWLQQNVAGNPVILEAYSPLYRWGSRISIHTGLPTVIGWDWHQKQQRAALPTDIIDKRKAIVTTLYTTDDVEKTVALLKQYRVSYIYIGKLETLYYSGSGLDKFMQASPHWSVVYQNQEVTILQVH